MLKFRRVLRTLFGYAALVYLLAGIPLIPVLIKSFSLDQEAAASGRTFTATESLLLLSKFIFLSATVIGAISGVAWWTLKTGRRGARVWAIAASVTFLLASAFLAISDSFLNRHGATGHPPLFFEIQAVQMFIGFGGLFAFGWKQSQADMVAPAPPPRIPGDGTHKLVDALALILQVGGTIWLMNLYSRWGYEQRLPFARGAESLIQWVVVILAAVFIHESAHALFGIALGMRLRAFFIGPFQFRVHEGRWKFDFRPTQILAFSGAAGLIPVNPDQSRWDEVAMIAAGPLSNLITGAVAAAMAYSALDHVWWPFWEYFALFATVSLVGGIVNLIPFRPESLYSDGARILQLFRHSPAADFQRVVKSVHSTLVSPRRPRDYDIATMERAAAYFTRGHDGLLLRIWAASCLFDRRNLAGASAALAEAERVYRESASDIPPFLHTGFIIKGINLGRDRDYIRKWWQSMVAKKPTDLDQDYWLAKSAFHWAEGDLPAAREAWNTGQVYLAKLPDQGTYNYDRDCYRKIKEILDHRSTESEVPANQEQPDTPLAMSGAVPAATGG